MVGLKPIRLMMPPSMSHVLTWRRTQIGGVELRYDFCAYVDGNVNIARIYRDRSAENHTIWSCNMAAW